jgi:hypothetical protein
MKQNYKAIENIEQLDMYWDEYQTQGMKVVSRINVDNCHDLMNINSELQLVSTRRFIESITVHKVNARLVFKAANDNIKLISTGRKNNIELSIRDSVITGNKRLYILQQILKYGNIIDTEEAEEWSIYIVEFNKYVYSIGFNKDNPNVAFFKDYKPYKYEPNTKDYYKQYRQPDNTKVRRTPQLVDPQYGDHASGLGSIFTDQIKEELQDIIEYIAAVKDDSEYAYEIEALRELLSTDEKR